MAHEPTTPEAQQMNAPVAGVTVTEKEWNLLQDLAMCEFSADGHGYSMPGCYTYTRFSPRSFSGIVASLVKKGVVISSEFDQTGTWLNVSQFHHEESEAEDAINGYRFVGIVVPSLNLDFGLPLVDEEKQEREEARPEKPFEAAPSCDEMNALVPLSTTTPENREAWLTETARMIYPVIDAVAQSFAKDYRPVPFDDFAFACSITSGGSTQMRKVAGEIHYAEGTGNGKHEVRIAPSQDDSVQVLGVVIHEMIHAFAIGDGHRGDFARIARFIGLKGKMTATYVEKDAEKGDRLRCVVDSIIKIVGEYPHQKVRAPVPRGKRGIGSRMLKIVCTECDLVMRASSMQAEKIDRCDCPVPGCVGYIFVDAWWDRADL